MTDGGNKTTVFRNRELRVPIFAGFVFFPPPPPLGKRTENAWKTRRRHERRNLEETLAADGIRRDGFDRMRGRGKDPTADVRGLLAALPSRR